jgi:hypothetical protein
VVDHSIHTRLREPDEIAANTVHSRRSAVSLRALRRFLPATLFLSLLVSPAWIKWHFFSDHRPVGLAVLLIPALTLGAALVISGVARAQPLLRQLLIAGLVLKIVFAAGYSGMTFQVYGSADNVMYFDTATTAPTMELATGYWRDQTVGTAFVLRLTWVLMRVVGESFSGLSVVFALLAFSGACLLFYAALRQRATIDSSLLLVLLLFFPSFVFWSATIGKEAPIVFSIGLFSWGLSSVLAKGLRPLYLLSGGLGLLGCMMIRPHIAAMLAVASFSAFTISSPRRSPLGLLGRFGGIGLLGFGLVYVMTSAQAFLRLEEVSIASGTVFMTERIGITNVGGSALGIAALGERLSLGPFFLFRPFPWEISSPMALLVSIEGLFLLWLFWSRRRSLKVALRSALRDPYLLFQLIFVIGFVVAFSSISNWGIIARQRVMIYPMIFFLLCQRPEGSLQRRSYIRVRRSVPPPVGLERPRLARR